jgi:CRP-like cAMP-binding protein
MITAALLRAFVPFNTLADGNLERLATQLSIEEVPTGKLLCQEGANDNTALYLIKGGVEITSKGSTIKQFVQGGTPDAAFALAPGTPRQFSVKATTLAQVLRVDNQKLDRVTVFDSVTTIITTIGNVWEKKDNVDDEWAKVLEANPSFGHLSSRKLSELIQSMEELKVKPRKTIVQQNKPNKYYYVVKEGRFTIARKDEKGKVQIAGEITRGGTFGEESVATGDTSALTVIAMSDGILMRLSKANFDKFLKSA